MLNYDDWRIAGKPQSTQFLDYQVVNATVEAERDHLRVGDHFVRVLTMKEAITETRPLVLDSLLKIAANFYVVTEWTPLLLAPPLLRAQSSTAAEANSHVGETTTVCGKVSGVHTAAASRGKPTFINFDKPYPSQDFTVMIWDDERPAFGNLEKYVGRQVCVYGAITMYRGKPEMILRDPETIRAK